MNKSYVIKTGLSALAGLLVLSCNNNDDQLSNQEDLNATALNAADLELLDNCGKDLVNTEAVNCCILSPDEVIIGGTYAGGAKYLVSNGGQPYEPTGLTYEWKVTGKGMTISATDTQFVTFEFDENFTEGTIETKVFAEDGSIRCSGIDAVVLKKD